MMCKTTRFIFLLSVVLLLPACCGKSTGVREARNQGLYEGGTEVRQMEIANAATYSLAAEKPETYGRY